MQGFTDKLLAWLGHHAWAGVGSIAGVLGLVLAVAQCPPGGGSAPSAPEARPAASVLAQAPDAGYVSYRESRASLRPESGREGRFLAGDRTVVTGEVKVYDAARSNAELLGVWPRGTRLRIDSAHGEDWLFCVRTGA